MAGTQPMHVALSVVMPTSIYHMPHITRENAVTVHRIPGAPLSMRWRP